MSHSPAPSDTSLSRHPVGDRVLLRGRRWALAPGWIERLCRPVAVVHDIVGIVYQRALSMLWREVIVEEDHYGCLAHLLLTAVVALACPALFYLGYLDEFLIYGGTALWIADRFSARHCFRKGTGFRPLALGRGEDGLFVWTGLDENGERERVSFPAERATEILVGRRGLWGGAFEHSLAVVWRVRIILSDGRELPMGEHDAAGPALEQGRELSRLLDAPLHLDGSENDCDFHQDMYHKLRHALFKRHHLEVGNTLRVEETPERLRLTIDWADAGRRRLIREAFRRAGLLLFLFIAAGLMARIGLLVDLAWGPAPALNPLRGLPLVDAVSAFFTARWNWLDLADLSAALALVGLAARRLDRRRRIEMDDAATRFFIDDVPAGELASRNIRLLSLVHGPEPVVLVADDRNVLEIGGLYAEEEYRAVMLVLDHGLKRHGPEAGERACVRLSDSATETDSDTAVMPRTPCLERNP